MVTANLDTDDEMREITLEAVGPRWAGVSLHGVVAEACGGTRP